MKKSLVSRLPIALKRLIVPFGLVLSFSLLLTFLFFLHRPRGLQPIENTRFGWQAWDIVSYGNNPPQNIVGGEGDGQPEPTHWWEVPVTTTGQIAQTLPLDIWDPLLPHQTGLTELAIESCIFNPESISFCDPPSSPAADATKGRWVRVESDLNWKTGLWYLNVYYRRTRRLDVPLITDLTLLPDGAEPPLQGNGTWHRVPTDVRNGVYPSQSPLFLWYEVGGEKTVITELDIIRGDGPAWYGFEKTDHPVVSARPGKTESVWITYRRGVKTPPAAQPLHFHSNGTFTIMQVADLHFSVSNGKCRDTDLYPCDEGDVESDRLLARVLDAEKPDMVVFSGDQLNGQGTSYDSKSVIAKFAKEVIARKIPWAAVFGNHDDETDLSRLSEMKLLQGLPYCLASPGPSTADGVGNYVLKVKSGDPSATHLLTLYFLDSGGYAKNSYNPFAKSQYDWLKASQAEWFLKESASILPIERPFTPDGTSDLGHIWRRSPGKRRLSAERQMETTLAKPNAMMWFHIPLPEAFSDPDWDADWAPLEVGQQLGGPGASTHNGNFFEDGILLAAESDAGGQEVKVVGHGHDHTTDVCRRIKGVWFCFGGGGSYSGYGQTGFDRRFRVFKVSDFGETIRTYKHTEHDDIVDDVILVGKGALGLGAPQPTAL